MWDFILQIIYFLILAGIIGATITFVVYRLLGDKERPRIRDELETKIHNLQHDLEKSSEALKLNSERLISLEMELGESANMVKTRDAQLKELRDRLMSFEEIEAELAAKKSEVESLHTEINSARAKLVEAESKLEKPIRPEMIAELNSLKKKLAGKDNEITHLLNRVKELAPLSLQIRDRELRILELEKKHADEIRAKDVDIANLGSRITDFEAKLRLAEINSESSNAIPRAAEIAMLKRRINELETMHILAVHPPPKDQWDDLFAISHSGPALVRMLHRLGIYNFRQVAIWDDELIDWIDSQLERFHGRIRREHWVENAKNEHYKKYGERL
jgi:predicted flap endonuclease-1-like 5' DNA nuclease